MKKYYINIRNSKKKMIVDLLPIPIFSIYIVFFLWLVLTYPWIVAIPFGFVICMLAYFVIPYSVYALTNHIYVDEEKGEILLKRFRRKDQVIKFSSISRLESANNRDLSLGAGSKGGGIYAVKDAYAYSSSCKAYALGYNFVGQPAKVSWGISYTTYRPLFEITVGQNNNAANSVVNNYGGGNMRCSVPGRLFAQCCALWR